MKKICIIAQEMSKFKKLLNILTILLFVSTILYTFYSIEKIISTKAPDFEVLWLAAKDLPSGKNLYLNPNFFTGVGYPISTLLFYLPLINLDYQVAQAIFILISFTAIVSTIYLSIKLVLGRVPLSWFSLAMIATFLSFPTKFTLGMGQNNSLAIFGLLVAYFFFKKNKKFLSGLFLGLTISLKTIFGFFFLFYLLKSKWKIIAYASLIIITSLLVAGFIGNYDYYVYYVKNIIPPLLNLEGREIYYNQGLMGFVSRTTESLVLRKYLGGVISFLVIITTSILTFKKKYSDLQFSLHIITLPILDSLSWQHHFIWLIFPFIVLTKEILKMKNKVALTLLLLSYFLISWNFKNPNSVSPYLLSNTFYGTIILWGLNVSVLTRASNKEKN